MTLPFRMSGGMRSPLGPSAYGVRPGAINGSCTALLALWIMLAALSGPARAEPVRLLAFGDSLVAGYGLPQDRGFTATLERALADAGYEVAVTNAGSSGDTTAGGLARIGWSLSDKPDAAIVVLGGNDGLRGLEPSETYANLAGILTELRQAGVPALLAGMLAPPNLGQDYGAEFRDVYTRLGGAFDIEFYPFFLDGVAAESALNQPDGIHPNEKGVQVIVDRMLPMVEALLKRAGAAES